MDSLTLTLHTGDRLFTDVTEAVADFVTGRGDGMVNVLVPHATAGIAVFELRAGSEPDVEAAIERLLPSQDIYVHRHGSAGHGRDHVLPAFVAPVMTLPVIGGVVPLGTWQSIVLVDPNGDNPVRSLRLSFAPVP